MPHAGQGSTIYTAKELAERALRLVGAFSINEDAAGDADMAETLYWLDMLAANEAGTRRAMWLVKDELTIDLVAADGDYVLTEELNAQLPEGTQFPIAATLDENGTRTKLRIVTQREFRRLSMPDTAGTPVMVFIDRLNGPTMHVYPVPDTADAGHQIVLTVQSFAKSLKPKGVTANTNNAEMQAGFRPAWNLWAAFRLASMIGNGAVRTLPVERVREYRTEAATLELRLEGFENADHSDDPPYTQGSSYL